MAFRHSFCTYMCVSLYLFVCACVAAAALSRCHFLLGIRLNCRSYKFRRNGFFFDIFFTILFMHISWICISFIHLLSIYLVCVRALIFSRHPSCFASKIAPIAGSVLAGRCFTLSTPHTPRFVAVPFCWACAPLCVHVHILMCMWTMFA